MHPEVVRDGPGSCPICGMALEPTQPSADDDDNPELMDMTRRFWFAAALTLPLVVVAMGGSAPRPPDLGHLLDARTHGCRTRAGYACLPLVGVAVLCAGHRVGEKQEPQHVHAHRSRA
jgi:hypothetical protein